MRIFTSTALFLSLAAAAFGQGDRGTITGTISDPAGAVVAAAAVQARHVATGTVYDTTSTNTGNYTISELPVGSYEVTVTVPGFKKYIRSGLTVEVAATVRVDVGLEVGAASESVTVNEAAPLLKTESGELSHNVPTETVDQLPILGIGSNVAGSSAIRNPQAVAYLLPGAFIMENSNMRINGAPGNTASYRLEGQDASNGQVPATQAQTQPSVDAIQEVTVQTSNFAAEYGMVGGGFFNYTMKSGTNQLHGSAYDYFVNEALNSNTPWLNVKPTARRNDYGFTVGGPVFIPKVYNGHDKTFFFFNFEQYYETETINNILDTVPTAQYRVGNFAQALTGRILGTDPLGRPIPEGGVYDPNTQRTAPTGQLIRDQFPGNAVPLSRLDPVAVNIQNLMPQPNQGSGVINNYVNPFPSVRNTFIPAFKIDHSMGSKAKFSYYWSRTRTASQLSPTLGGADGLPQPISGEIGTFITSYAQRANFEYTLAPTVLFHFGAGWMNDFFTDNSLTTDYNPASAIGLNGVPVNRMFPYMTGLCPAGTSNGTVTATCGGQGGMKVMGPTTNRDPILYNKPTFNTSLTWVKGNHTFKYGGELRIETNEANLYKDTNGAFTFSPNETGLPYIGSSSLGGGTVGFGYASFMLGAVDQLQLAPINQLKMGKWALGMFAQDTWKVTRKFTLDYGLRYDYQTYLRETGGRYAQFAPNVANPTADGQPGAVEFEGSGMTATGVARCNCQFAKNYPLAFGPRLGAAYQINSKTVVRVGVGIVYSAIDDANGASSGGLSIPNAVGTTSFGQPLMTLAKGIPSSILAPFPNWNVGQFPTASAIGAQAPETWYDQNAGRPARQYQWSVGVQRQLMKDLAVEASYVGNRGIWWNAPALVDVNALTPQRIAAAGLNINNPADVTLLQSPLTNAAVIARGFKPPFGNFPSTLTLAQSLRPFPQFNSITALWAPDGNTRYDSLQAKATKRFSHGLQGTVLFTWAKNLSDASPSNVTIPGTGGQAVNDVFNRGQNMYISPYDIPLALTIAPSYTLPTLHGNKLVSWAVRDWQINALLGYASGLPILAPQAQNNLNLSLLRNNTGAQTSYANRVSGQPLFTQDINCHCFDPNKVFILNPLAWSQPGPGQWGSGAAYYSDYRQQRRPNENMSLGRIFRIREKITLNIRGEFSNIFNRAEMPVPTSTNAAATQVHNAAGVPTTGFGFIATANEGAITNIQTATSRQGVIVARFIF
ncbi:MAG TPA: carboxypeptidase-like regulatory domain-containing protein [Bryobacteraceae bacterium]|nr:carboxypeptidase-like regulatory domain-containing protein [Bryobacteraceae bacterium]